MPPPIETLTIHLPANAAHRLRRVAEIARRPVDEVIADTLQVSLPPLLEDVPEAFRNDLARLETLSNEELWQHLREELPASQIARYDQLLAANTSGALDEAGRGELAQLRRAADSVMFRKAYAALLLRWRGERVPSLAELEAEAP
jgi:hypothetical protein